MTAAELGPADRVGPGKSREELRLVELASGLLLLLDAHRLTGRLPLDVQVQASRLRHAVKVVIQAEAARSRAPVPPSSAVQGLDPAAAIPAAARYLVDHGARHHLDRALFAYNHSWAYVARVQQLARRYAPQGGGRR